MGGRNPGRRGSKMAALLEEGATDTTEGPNWRKQNGCRLGNVQVASAEFRRSDGHMD